MFVFGDETQAADLIFEEGSQSMGPGAPKGAPESLDLRDLRTLLTYNRIAYVAAVRDGATDGVVSIIVERYDKVFRLLCERSKDFCNVVLDGGHHYLEGFNESQIKKYHAIVEEATSAS